MNAQTASTIRPKLTRTEREENAVMRRVIRDALDAGCTLDVFDGDETTVHGSTDARAVFAALRTTSEDKLTLRRDGVRVGWVLFVYGNSGEEVIADYTDNVAMDLILAGAEALAARYGSRS